MFSPKSVPVVHLTENKCSRLGIIAIRFRAADNLEMKSKFLPCGHNSAPWHSHPLVDNLRLWMGVP
jgi:hypothetical protein